MTKRIAVILLVGSVSVWAGNSQINDSVLDGANRLLGVGFANNIVDRSTDYALARYLPDGSLDASFNPNGELPGTLQVAVDLREPSADAPPLNPLNETLTGVALTDDNKIVAAGVTAVGLDVSVAVLKLLENGSFDTTFNAQGLLGPMPGYAVINLSEFPGVTDIATGVTEDTATDVKIDSQGRIIIVGSTDNGQNIELFVIRLTADGMLDTTFNAGSFSPGIFTFKIVNDDGTQDDIQATAVTLTPEDDIVVGGFIIARATSSVDVSTNFIIVKVTSLGTLDLSFNSTGTRGYVTQNFGVFNNEAFAIVLDQQGRILIGGFSSRFDPGDVNSTGGSQNVFALARYLQDGTLDTTFNSAGLSDGEPGTVLTPISQNIDSVRDLAITSDNKIVATGLTDSATNRSFATARYLESGVLDTTFNEQLLNGPGQGIVVTTISPVQGLLGQSGFSAIGQANSVVLNSEDEILVSGFSFDGLQDNFTSIKYTVAGNLDGTFLTGGTIQAAPGIVITPFGESLTSRGNGVPIYVTEDLTGVAPQLVKQIDETPRAILPRITTTDLVAGPDGIPMVAGTAAPNAMIALYLNMQTAPYATTTANKEGRWSVDFPFTSQGAYTLSVLAADPVTGVRLASQPQSLNVVATQLAAPQVATIALEQEGYTAKGAAQGGESVRVYLDEAPYGDVIVDDTGQWEVPLGMLDEGSYQITADVQSTAGLQSRRSDPYSLTVTPVYDAVQELTSALPVYEQAVQGKVFRAGTATPGSKVALYSGDQRIGSTVANEKGQWTYSSLIQGPLNELMRVEILPPII